MSPGPIRVLFVCMGNICRSPSAEAVFREQLRAHGLSHRCEVDSAGTHGYHIGEPPDPRSQAHARQRGIDMSALRARQVQPSDFGHFDLLLAMDANNLALLRQRCPADQTQSKLRLLTEFCLHASAEAVPDPYYGGPEGFEQVLDIVEDACEGLRQHLFPA
ncbi:low molecular weight protein-tyrosine-phosphatase [Paucibacter sp. Y2R2-4]|uniref:low molecular weight protein-tyrosine-phosphatase n=1 Tax=Paucibacter sp. Y2R2-4 TaxID=2893553 RepID=UPI0021E36E62|nr:low molecular weight protein-tyrosine-phosphatase [Paucibacter sp. Y2R2-4]MCV2349436.1 low molecular weight phosphotyrosine protein phosphatase [Paucibacter sp. Y2R2-4]